MSKGRLAGLLKKDRACTALVFSAVQQRMAFEDSKRPPVHGPRSLMRVTGIGGAAFMATAAFVQLANTAITLPVGPKAEVTQRTDTRPGDLADLPALIIL